MKNKSVVFTNAGQLEIQQSDFELTPQNPHEVVVRTHFSLISAGTELACLSGSENWFKFPSTPGYTSVGEVVAAGPPSGARRPGGGAVCWGGGHGPHPVGLYYLAVFFPPRRQGNL